MLKFTSYKDLADTIRCNLWKIPHDIDCIVGVPRSGMMVAIMLSEYLNIPVRSLNEYIASVPAESGGRGRMLFNTQHHRVLIIDDTVYSGKAMSHVTKKLASVHPEDNKIYACVYAEGEHATDMVDIYLKKNYCPNLDFYHLYEWNLLHHGKKLTARTMYDLDGVLCKNPPDERNTKAYEEYIENALPLIIPSSPIHSIATYRLCKYRIATERWLMDHGISYENLYMTDGDYQSRRLRYVPGKYKAMLYGDSNDILFIESDPQQAYDIFDFTHKPVYCIENGKFFSL